MKIHTERVPGGSESRYAAKTDQQGVQGLGEEQGGVWVVLF